VDAQIDHEVEDPDLVLFGRIADRGRLETVAEGFVIEFDRSEPRQFRLVLEVPVEGQILLFHCDSCPPEGDSP